MPLSARSSKFFLPARRNGGSCEQRERKRGSSHPILATVTSHILQPSLLMSKQLSQRGASTSSPPLSLSPSSHRGANISHREEHILPQGTKTEEPSLFLLRASIYLSIEVYGSLYGSKGHLLPPSFHQTSQLSTKNKNGLSFVFA